MVADLTARIRARAYELWAADGRPEGTHVGYWLKAEREVKAAKDANDKVEPPHKAASNVVGLKDKPSGS